MISGAEVFDLVCNECGFKLSESKSVDSAMDMELLGADISANTENKTITVAVAKAKATRWADELNTLSKSKTMTSPQAE